VSKKPSLSAALHEASGKKPISPAQPSAASIPTPVPAPASELPPSRQGKKIISGYFDPAVSKQLKQLALEQDSTVQALLAEALDLLFVEYGKAPIAGGRKD
jgi:hypothetical protein